MQRLCTTATFDTPFAAALAVECCPIAPFRRPHRAFWQHLSLIGNHTFRATGITAYLNNNGALETAQHIANHASPRTTMLYDRRQEEISLDEAERIAI